MNQRAEQSDKNSFVQHLQNHLLQQLFNPTGEVRFMYNSLERAPKGKHNLLEKGKAEAFGQVEPTNHRSHQAERTTATQ